MKKKRIHKPTYFNIYYYNETSPIFKRIMLLHKTNRLQAESSTYTRVHTLESYMK